MSGLGLYDNEAASRDVQQGAGYNATWNPGVAPKEFVIGGRKWSTFDQNATEESMRKQLRASADQRNTRKKVGGITQAPDDHVYWAALHPEASQAEIDAQRRAHQQYIIDSTPDRKKGVSGWTRENPLGTIAAMGLLAAGGAALMPAAAGAGAGAGAAAGSAAGGAASGAGAAGATTGAAGTAAGTAAGSSAAAAAGAALPEIVVTGSLGGGLGAAEIGAIGAGALGAGAAAQGGGTVSNLGNQWQTDFWGQPGSEIPGINGSVNTGTGIYGPNGIGNAGAGPAGAGGSSGGLGSLSTQDYIKLAGQVMPQGQQQDLGAQANAQMGRPNMTPSMGQRINGGIDKGLGKLGGALLPIDPRVAATMDPAYLKQLQSNALLQMGLGMMSNASQGGRFGEALATGVGLGQAGLGRDIEQTYQRGVTDRELKRDEARYSEMQKPANVREYEYAVKDGFKGSFKDWTIAGGQTSRPSSVQEWEFFRGLSANEQMRYLEMKRNPNFVVKDVNQAPTAIQGLPGGGVQATPLSTTASEAAAAGQVKGAESQAGAIGAGLGTIQAGIQTKGANATTVQGMLDIAEPLIEVATGSGAGAAYDTVAKFMGSAPDGAKAIASLQVLQAGLMTNMPRMEGPQSDRDVDLYRQAAGQIGDPTVPPDIKKAAIATIREIQNKYAQRANGTVDQPTQPTLDDIRKKYGRKP